MKSNRFAIYVVVGVVFIALGILAGLTVRVFPVQASAEAVQVDSLFNFMLAIAVVVFLIVEGGIIYSIFRFRRKKGDETDGLPMHGNTALEITWTAIPAVIVFVLSIYSYAVYVDIRSPNEGELEIGVIGQQFQWSFTYPMPPDSDPAVTPELREKIATYMIDSTMYVPINRPIRAKIESRDVIHSFFIPEFRIKQDATPGNVTEAFFTPTLIGEWWVLCAELCGVGHGNMSQINRVVVVEQAKYDEYIAGLYAKAKATASDPTSPEVGKQLIQQKYPCGACHILTDAGLNQNKIGPSLNGIATRAEGHAAANEGLVGGTDAKAYLRASIIAPNRYVVAGYQAGIMPQNYGSPSIMPPDDLEAIINYLATQTQQ